MDKIGPMEFMLAVLMAATFMLSLFATIVMTIVAVQEASIGLGILAIVSFATGAVLCFAVFRTPRDKEDH